MSLRRGIVAITMDEGHLESIDERAVALED
jgi:hypothetical protein